MNLILALGRGVGFKILQWSCTTQACHLHGVSKENRIVNPPCSAAFIKMSFCSMNLCFPIQLLVCALKNLSEAKSFDIGHCQIVDFSLQMQSCLSDCNGELVSMSDARSSFYVDHI